MLPLDSPTVSGATPEPPTPWATRIGVAAMTVARFLLAFGMMPYAVNKLMDYQFQVSAWTYAKPLEQASGKALAWSMLGYSPTLQVLLGVFEAVPALLLLLSRTRRIGALLMFPVLLNVVLINFFLNLWHDTKIISSVFLALNIFLLLYDLRLYLSFFNRLLVPPTPIARPGVRVVARVASLVIPLLVIGGYLIYDFNDIARATNPIHDFIGVRQINGAGGWKIESLHVSGVSVDAVIGNKLFFDFSNKCVLFDGTNHSIGDFQADKAHNTFQISNVPIDGNSQPITGTYRIDGDHMLLEGQRSNQPVSLLLKRTEWGSMLP